MQSYPDQPDRGGLRACSPGREKQRPLCFLGCRHSARKVSSGFFPTLVTKCLKTECVAGECTWTEQHHVVLGSCFVSFVWSSGLSARDQEKRPRFLIVLLVPCVLGTILTIQGAYACLSPRPALSQSVATGHLWLSSP